MVTDQLARLTWIATELSSLHLQLADMLRAEHEARTLAWFDTEETTIQGRDRVAARHALELSLEVIKLKGEIAALAEERDNLRFQIEHA